MSTPHAHHAYISCTRRNTKLQRQRSAKDKWQPASGCHGPHYCSQSTCAFARACAAWKLSQNFLSTSRTCRGRCWSGAPSTGPADPAPGCVGAGVSSNSPSPSWPKLAAPAERRQARLQAQGSAREARIAGPKPIRDARIAGPKPIRETRIAGPKPFNCFHNEPPRKHASRPRL